MAEDLSINQVFSVKHDGFFEPTAAVKLQELFIVQVFFRV
jgi:hypothetical protein